MSTRTLIYARVSTEDQVERYGLPLQIRACREYAKANGLQVAEEITDDGVSGTLLQRPGLDHVRALVRDGQADLVLMYDVDRLSRELAHLLILKPELEKAGARLAFVQASFEDSPSGRLFFSLRGVIAQYEREQMLQRMGRGKRERAMAGRIVGGRVLYGYVYQNGLLAVDEPKAAIVRQIFEWCDSGASLREITRRLRNSGASPARAGRWGRSSVHRILINETYAGVAHYGTHQRQGAVLRKRADLSQRIAISVPPIVPRPLWERVQARLSQNVTAACGRPSVAYLLRGRLFCGQCGRRMNGEWGRSRAYRCTGRDTTANHSGERCTEHVSVSLLDSRVWAALVDAFGKPEWLRSVLAKHRAELQAPAVDVEELRRQASALRRREDAAASAMLDPEFVAERSRFRQAHREAREARARIEGEIAMAERAAVDDVGEWLTETAALLREDLAGRVTPESRQEFARWFVRRAEYANGAVRMRLFIGRKWSTTSADCGQFADGFEVVFSVDLREAA